MLPINLHQDNFLIVTGCIYPTEATNEETHEKVVTDAIELQFTVQVNNHLTRFTHSFLLAPSEVSSEITIVQWSEWHLLVRILSAMGYLISNQNDDNKWAIESQEIIKRWTRSLLASKPEIQ